MMDGFISSSCVCIFYFKLSLVFCSVCSICLEAMQREWDPCKMKRLKNKPKKNRVWMLRGPCWCCWRGLRECFFFFFFFKSTAKQERQEGRKLVSFFDPTSLWRKYDSASSEWFKEEISDQLNFSLWLYGTTFHSSYQTSSFRPDSQQTMLEMWWKTKINTRIHTHTHTLSQQYVFPAESMEGANDSSYWSRDKLNYKETILYFKP